MGCALCCLVGNGSTRQARVWRTISLTDGTQVKVQLVGDEFMHYYQSADGTRYIYDAASATYQVYSDSQFSNSRRKAVARRAKANKRRAVRRKANVTNIFQGTKKGLIILAQFTDSKFQSGHDRALYNKIANAENYTDNGFKGSVKDYFKAQSAGQFELDFDVVGICQLKNPCSYYGGNDAYTGDDLRAGEMVAEACQWAATQGIDFSQYDWDGDGEVDRCLCFMLERVRLMAVLNLRYGHTSLLFLIPIMVSRFPLVASLWILMPAVQS